MNVILEKEMNVKRFDFFEKDYGCELHHLYYRTCWASPTAPVVEVGYHFWYNGL